MQIDDRVLGLDESEWIIWLAENEIELSELDLGWLESWQAYRESSVIYYPRHIPYFRRAHRSQWRHDELRSFDIHLGRLTGWGDKE